MLPVFSLKWHFFQMSLKEMVMIQFCESQAEFLIEWGGIE